MSENKESRLEYFREYQREYYKENKEEISENRRLWYENNPEKVKQRGSEQCRKGGKRYEKMLEYEGIGLRKERSSIRRRDRKRWKRFKDIIASDTEVHHEWIPGTAKYNGIALVDKSEHQHGMINPVLILEGEIKLMEEM